MLYHTQPWKGFENTFQLRASCFFFFKELYFAIGKIILLKHSKAITLNYSLSLIINKWKHKFSFLLLFKLKEVRLGIQHTISVIQSYQDSTNTGRDSQGMVLNTRNLQLPRLNQRRRGPGQSELHNNPYQNKTRHKAQTRKILKNFLNTSLLTKK